MKNIIIDKVGTLLGYTYDDLSPEAQERAIIDAAQFEEEWGRTEEDAPYKHIWDEMERQQTPWFFVETLIAKERDSLIETLQINEYLFDIDGDIIPLCHYVGDHPEAGKVLYKDKYTATIEDIKPPSKVDFWISMFKPRTKTYQRETLARLKKKVSQFETPEENADKIKALKFLLNQ